MGYPFLVWVQVPSSAPEASAACRVLGARRAIGIPVLRQTLRSRHFPSWAVSSAGRARRLHRRCRGFEPLTAHRSHSAAAALPPGAAAVEKTVETSGLVSPSPYVVVKSWRRAEIAQLVEHTTENRSVDSSILSLGTSRLGHGGALAPASGWCQGCRIEATGGRCACRRRGVQSSAWPAWWGRWQAQPGGSGSGVEHLLAKEKVAGSNPVFRSHFALRLRRTLVAGEAKARRGRVNVLPVARRRGQVVKAELCKSSIAGSIPAVASPLPDRLSPWCLADCEPRQPRAIQGLRIDLLGSSLVKGDGQRTVQGRPPR